MVLLGFYLRSAFNTKVLSFPLRLQNENGLIYHLFSFTYAQFIDAPASMIYLYVEEQAVHRIRIR
ncbi:unnamed protein product, partial [Vitis vinifera]